jgi:hypothetical protein
MAGDLVPERRDLRASHEDRDRVAEQLRVAAGDGRLSADELDERLEAALTARTYGELESLVTDLPVGSAPVPQAAAKDVVRIEVGSGSAQRVGPWVVPRRLEVAVRSGSVKLDFTAAAMPFRELDIAASVASGSLRLIVPPDVLVDADDVSVQSGSVSQKKRPLAGAGAVRLRIQVSGQVRSGRISVRGPRPPRRSFWGWLTRQPRPVPSALPR